VTQYGIVRGLAQPISGIDDLRGDKSLPDAYDGFALTAFDMNDIV
jgi:hypothetical protein